MLSSPSYRKILHLRSSVSSQITRVHHKQLAEPRQLVVSASLPQNPILIYDLAPAPGHCPYAQRSKIVLKEKGLPHKVELIDVNNKPKEFLDLFRGITANPEGRGTVPTIIDGDVKLTESNVVSEYLDTAYPDVGTKLFPTDPVKLAKVRLFLEIFQSGLGGKGFGILSATTQKAVDDVKLSITKDLEVLDGFLKTHGLEGGDFLLGAEYSYAEVASAPFVYRYTKAFPEYRDFDFWKVIEDKKLDRLGRWIKASFSRPAFKDTLSKDEDVIGRLSKFVKPLEG